MAKYTYAVMRDGHVISQIESETKITHAVATWRDMKFDRGAWQKVEPFLASVKGAVNIENAEALKISELAEHAGMRSEILEIVEV